MRLFCLLILLLNVKFASGNDTIPKVARNTLGLSGSNILFRGACSFYYERLVGEDINSTFFIHSGFGGAYFLEGVKATDNSDFTYLVNSYTVPVALVYLTNKRKNNHLEINGGLHFLIKVSASGFMESDHNRYAPGYKNRMKFLLNLGYRYQKPQGGFVFRTYAGLYGLGLGLGYAF